MSEEITEIKEFKRFHGAIKFITFRGKTKAVKISILCQYCPNIKCKGYYRIDAPKACLTFKSWKEGKITLEEAIEIKHKQNERHAIIDPIRREIYDMLKEQCDNDNPFMDREMAYAVASEIVKGKSLDEALKGTSFYLSKEQRKKIYELLNEIKGFLRKH
jgi:hypothetical protein